MTLYTLEDIELLAKEKQPFEDTPGRVHRAAIAVSAYVKVAGRDLPESAIGDLIADLLHLANAVKYVDPDEVLENGRTHFQCEVNNPQRFDA